MIPHGKKIYTGTSGAKPRRWNARLQHVAISIPPKLSVATLIGQLKGASSHHINHKYAGGSFMWQAEYGVFSFSERSLSRIVDYINNQKRHHADNTLDRAMENIALDGIKP